MQINALKKTFSEAIQSRNSSNRRPFEQTNENHRGSYRDVGIRRPESRKICWHCNGAGHLKHECPKIDCFQCGEQGHFARDCQKGKHDSRNRNLHQCNECGNPGHIARNCALRNRRWLNGRNVNALEEMGNTISTIHETSAKNDGGPIDPWTLVGPSGRH